MNSAQKNIFLLGATGSIGASTLQVIRRHPHLYRVIGLTGHKNMELLAQLVLEFDPQYTVVTSQDSYLELKALLRQQKTQTQILSTQTELLECMASNDVDIVVAGIVGKAGLRPTLAAARAGKQILLANKESMVMAGPLFRQAVVDSGARIFPIDSEHNAIFQTLPLHIQSSSLVTQDKCESHGVHNLVLTASGGPFLKLPLKQFKNVTPAQACRHPNWSMGAKVSVDSATLMNKGLELIEACYLFGVKQSFVDVVIHPQSIVHSMVSYIDGTTLAHLSNPSMEVPIASGLAWPHRHTTSVQPLRWDQMLQLEFLPLPADRFTCFELARQAMIASEQNSYATTVVLNAANEVAVAAFLANTIGFTQIPVFVEKCLERFQVIKAAELEEILQLDVEVRAYVKALMNTNLVFEGIE